MTRAPGDAGAGGPEVLDDRAQWCALDIGGGGGEERGQPWGKRGVEERNGARRTLVVMEARTQAPPFPQGPPHAVETKPDEDSSSDEFIAPEVPPWGVFL